MMGSLPQWKRLGDGRGRCRIHGVTFGKLEQCGGCRRAIHFPKAADVGLVERPSWWTEHESQLRCDDHGGRFALDEACGQCLERDEESNAD